ncbi:Hsp70-like protein [Phytophthora palmivora]|uniref:Hsp70-like protein n=1 Tax=Phytophthora palmivora TaxID=4796 RepID=A0A2P4XM30_9STRA|nr:Hsp70-like protein [Phytophthora palmivora]
MLDAISLSEEELGMLFGPASNGTSGNSALQFRQPRVATGRKSSSRSRVSNAPGRQATKKTTTKHSTLFNAAIPARCGYRTGKCQNLQAFKRNGKLHKLCEFHRERANLNQKKLDRKKRMQRSKAFSSCGSVTSDDDSRSLDLQDESPRTVESAVTSSVFVKSEPDLLDPELLLPTSLDEAPLMLGCEELAIFCSLMTFDTNHGAPVGRHPARHRAITARTPCETALNY